VAQVDDYVVHAVKGSVVLDTCHVVSADEFALSSDYAVTLRNSEVVGDLVLTGQAGRVAECADLSDPWNDLSCSEQYCSDVPAGTGVGIECYCDTVHGPQDPTTGSCEDPPQIHLLQDQYDVYAHKPAGLDTAVFFINNGDKPLFWKAEVLSSHFSHAWELVPSSGNLSSCETGNFSARLAALDVNSFSDYEARLQIVSSTYPWEISGYDELAEGGELTYTRIQSTTVKMDMRYDFEAAADASLSEVLNADGKADDCHDLEATAGGYLEALIKPRDVDGLWIKGSGSDHFRASMRRPDDDVGSKDRTVCEVSYETDLDLHRVLCLLDAFQAGEFALDVEVGTEETPVGDSPYEVAVGCSDGFAMVNNTCGCEPGHKLEVETVQCTACAKGKYGATYATIDAPNPCTKCIEFM
jgi:hypothetical protein